MDKYRLKLEILKMFYNELIINENHSKTIPDYVQVL